MIRRGDQRCPQRVGCGGRIAIGVGQANRVERTPEAVMVLGVESRRSFHRTPRSSSMRRAGLCQPTRNLAAPMSGPRHSPPTHPRQPIGVRAEFGWQCGSRYQLGRLLSLHSHRPRTCALPSAGGGPGRNWDELLIVKGTSVANCGSAPGSVPSGIERH